MSGFPLSFTAPYLLIGLAALPVIWWLLRITPPRPVREVFAPLAILARLSSPENTPSKSPWWLTLLRLIIAGLVILGLANPVWNPPAQSAIVEKPLALIIDNGWGSASDWPLRVDTAESLIAEAEEAEQPIYLFATAENAEQAFGPFDGEAARKALALIKPRAVSVERDFAFARVEAALEKADHPHIAYLTDGIKTADDTQALASLNKIAGSVDWYPSDIASLVILNHAENTNDALRITANRASGNRQAEQLALIAYDQKNRSLGRSDLQFAPNETTATADFYAPVEMRNDVTMLHIEDASHAGATYLLDAANQRRRVALLSGGSTDMSQPLLSPLYYINKALEPYADLLNPNAADLLEAVPELIAQKPAVIIMADIGKLPASAEEQISEWVENGGTLLRFAGSKLANAETDDTLLPVLLRRGERSLGGALSWTEPQHLQDFPKNSPFAGLKPLGDVTVKRQVIAEPSPDLFDKTYASLSDGTPLVTGEQRGSGNLIFFHIAPDTSWSNLSISGTFVDMLRRTLALSRQTGAPNGSSDTTSWPPFLSLAADGTLMPAAKQALPLQITAGETPRATYQTPAGFYGTQDNLFALNLFDKDMKLEALEKPELTVPVTVKDYLKRTSLPLRGFMLSAAALLLALDSALLLYLSGVFNKRRRHLLKALILIGVLMNVAHFTPVSEALAQEQEAQQEPKPHDDSKPEDAAIIASVSQTRLAYIVTGKPETDDISKAGLRGLTFALADRTTMEPDDAIGLDPEKDIMAFYPLIYWPVEADAPMPSEEAIARVSAYMQQGGTVLFDTRDQLTASSQFDNAASANNLRLRAILNQMNVPALEPVPENHVISKTFYIMPEFPGRFSGSPLWVEAGKAGNEDSNRPVNAGDGVSSILITANDFAGAWAVNEQGEPLFPTIPNDPMQRIYALRGGINIVMYMLTGNYKSDQVHVPALLERLGN
ncbi:hypothetical protein FHS77_000453 [Paenochrobactrum gallinarii]|uniref:DUF4159 domain-containing protein n=1 Tax=Paenochrobactrum gallinarii TaxID=643673 RepID=A0A841LPH6_9HYPH|nr:DUF4159 domain-containing protein [Paenochrobactrum gallinarii]MBB6259945.1 hypothetical protein [Paenochrobactrum gallinarii]